MRRALAAAQAGAGGPGQGGDSEGAQLSDAQKAQMEEMIANLERAKQQVTSLLPVSIICNIFLLQLNHSSRDSLALASSAELEREAASFRFVRTGAAAKS